MKMLQKIMLFVLLCTMHLGASLQELSKFDEQALQLLGAMQESIQLQQDSKIVLPQVRDQFTQYLDSYLTKFGKVYKKQGGIFNGYSHVYHIGSKDNRDLAITVNQYPLLLKVLQQAVKTSDWGKSITIRFLVDEKNILSEQQITLHEIVSAIKQVPLPLSMQYSMTHIAIGAAAAAAIAAGAIIAYQSYKDPNYSIPGFANPFYLGALPVEKKIESSLKSFPEEKISLQVDDDQVVMLPEDAPVLDHHESSVGEQSVGGKNGIENLGTSQLVSSDMQDQSDKEVVGFNASSSDDQRPQDLGSGSASGNGASESDLETSESDRMHEQQGNDIRDIDTTAVRVEQNSDQSQNLTDKQDAESDGSFNKAWAWIKENPGKTATGAATVLLGATPQGRTLVKDVGKKAVSRAKGMNPNIAKNSVVESTSPVKESLVKNEELTQNNYLLNPNADPVERLEFGIKEANARLKKLNQDIKGLELDIKKNADNPQLISDLQKHIDVVKYMKQKDIEELPWMRRQIENIKLRKTFNETGKIDNIPIDYLGKNELGQDMWKARDF